MSSTVGMLGYPYHDTFAWFTCLYTKYKPYRECNRTQDTRRLAEGRPRPLPCASTWHPVRLKKYVGGHVGHKGRCTPSRVLGRAFHRKTVVVWRPSRQIKEKMTSVKGRKCCLATYSSSNDLLPARLSPFQSLGVGQLHWAPPLGWQEEPYWEGLAKLRAAGRIREVGLSNYGPKGVARAHRFLAKLDTPLASNQVRAHKARTAYPCYGNTCRPQFLVCCAARWRPTGRPSSY